MNTLRESRTKAVMPVRVRRIGECGNVEILLGCSYDISKEGALLGGISGGLAIGEIVTLERMGKKARFRVCRSDRNDMVGLNCLQPERDIWGLESAAPTPPQAAAQKTSRLRWLGRAILRTSH